MDTSAVPLQRAEELTHQTLPLRLAQTRDNGHRRMQIQRERVVTYLNDYPPTLHAAFIGQARGGVECCA